MSHPPCEKSKSIALAAPYLLILSVLMHLGAIAQAPPTFAADEGWMCFRGSNHHTGILRQKGSMNQEPVKKWDFMVGPDGGVDATASIYDVDGDGFSEVIFAYTDSLSGSQRIVRIYVVDGATGMLEWTENFVGSDEVTTQAIADVDNDGDIEIILGLLDEKIVSLDGTTGSLEWTSFVATRGSISIADVDGDSELEIVANGGFGNTSLSVLDAATGAIENNYPLITSSGNVVGQSSIPIADVDGDGDLDMIAIFRNTTTQYIQAFDGATGQTVWLNATSNPLRFLGKSTPAIDDVDGDGDLDLVVCGQKRKVYAYDASTGDSLWSNPIIHLSTNHSSPAIADLDLDGDKEVICFGGRHEIMVLDGDSGTLQWKDTVDHIGSWFSGCPKIGDFNSNEPGLEIIFSTSYKPNTNKVYMYSASGTRLWAYREINHSTEGVIVGDIDDDGCMEIIVGPDIGPTNGSKASFYALDDITDMQDCGKIEIDSVIADTNQENPLGIRFDAKDYKFSMYPNPTKGRLIVELNNPEHTIRKIHLMDKTGMSTELLSNHHSHKAVIDVSRFSRGLYILEVDEETLPKMRQRLVIE